MIHVKRYKMAMAITMVLIFNITFLTGCSNKDETEQTAVTKSTVQDAGIDKSDINQSKINNSSSSSEDTTQMELKEIKLDETMKEELDTFFSNFSEAYVEPFTIGKFDDVNLIHFGIMYIILNKEEYIEDKGDIYDRYIKDENIDEADMYYFGVKPEKHMAVGEYSYDNGYYKFPLATGGAYTFSQIDKLYDLGDGKYKAQISIYTASSGFTGDSHATMEQWEASEDEIPELSKNMTAIIMKSNDNEKERYLLLEYQQANAQSDNSVDTLDFGSAEDIKDNNPIDISFDNALNEASINEYNVLTAMYSSAWNDELYYVVDCIKKCYTYQEDQTRVDDYVTSCNDLAEKASALELLNWEDTSTSPDERSSYSATKGAANMEEANIYKDAVLHLIDFYNAMPDRGGEVYQFIYNDKGSVLEEAQSILTNTFGD